ncbi:unnamed protein product [Knipowitschia caucasica]
MASVIHVDQSYCEPRRLIGDNVTLVRDVVDVSGSLGINLGLISIDQEKAFDRVEHQYLRQTMTAFGFSPGFIAHIRTLYCDIMSVLKVRGRSIMQGCSLSGMLYSLSIEPLLHGLRADLQGVPVNCFGRVSSSKVNWSKSSATLLREGLRGLSLPGGLVWGTGGFKLLGVFLGPGHVHKNWDQSLEQVQGRLS